MNEKNRDKQADLQDIAALSAVLNWVGSDSANVIATLVNFIQNVLKPDRNNQDGDKEVIVGVDVP